MARLLTIAHEGNVFVLNAYLHDTGLNINSTITKDGETALFLAIRRKDEQAVQTLISAGADVNHKNVHGDTPLMVAACLGAVNMLYILKLARCSLDKSNAKGQTALMLACFGRHATFVQALIDLGVSVSKADIFGMTAVMLASQRQGRLEYLNILLAAGADVNATNNDGHTPLMLASREGALKCMKRLISHGVSINTVDENGMSALMLAATEGHPDCLRELIFAGCDTNLRDKYGNTALILATMYAKLECVKLLKTLWGTDVNAQNNEGMTALMLATSDSHHDILHHLLVAGANKDIMNDDDQTALMISIEKGMYKSFNTLLQAGASIHVTSDDGQTALMLAAANSDSRYVQTLMQTMKARGLFPGDHISKRDKRGNTALMIATKRGFTSNLEILIRLGAEFNTINEKAELSRVVSSLAGHENCARLLVQNRARFYNHGSDQKALVRAVVSDIVKAQIGAEVNVYLPDNQGRTLLHWAANAGHDHRGRGVDPLMSLMFADEFDMYHECYDLLEMDRERSLIIQLLYDSGSDMNVQDEDGMTALMMASSKGMVKTVQTLLDCGAYVNLKDNSGKTALMHVTDKNELDADNVYDIYERSWIEGNLHASVVKKLVDHDSDVNMKDENGMTTLMMACAEKKFKILPTLLECGANVNLQDHTGKTALMHFTTENKFYVDLADSEDEDWFDEDGLPSVVHQLVGADVNMRDVKGMTAVMYAAASPGWGSQYLISTLARHHACLDLLDRDGKSALVHAIENYDTDEAYEAVVSLLSKNAFPKLEMANAYSLASVSLLRFFNSMPELLDNEYTEAVVLSRLLVSNGIMPSTRIRHFCNCQDGNEREKWCPLLQTLQQEYDDDDDFGADSVHIAKYCMANCYISSNDMNRIRRNDLPLLNEDVKNFLKQAVANPWPLVKLAQIAVSTAIGPSPGRHERILQTGLPRPIMDCLMFDRPIALLNEDWGDIPMCFDPTQYSQQPFQYPLLYNWPVGRFIELCDCDVCKQKEEKFRFTKIVK